MKKDLTDKELLAMGKKVTVKKRVLFKDYAVTYINLGLAHRDNKTMRKELRAVAKRGADLVMKSILKKTVMPRVKFPEHQQPFITVIIYAGVKDDSGETTYTYPNALNHYRLEEV